MSKDNLQADTLKNIQSLQKMERELYDKLDTSVAGKSASKKEQEDIISGINELSEIRTSLYDNLKDMYSHIQGNVAVNRDELVNQLTTAGIVENELNNAKASLQALEDNRHNKLRMVEINTYFGSRYRAYSKLMRYVIYFSIPVLVLAVLARKEILSTNIANGLISLIIAVAIIVLGRELYDLGMRDNMNFDEYNWYFNPANVDTSGEIDSDTSEHPDFFNNDSKQATKDFFDDLEGRTVCEGDECCGPNQKYSKAKNKCISSEEAIDKLTNSGSGKSKERKSTVEAFTENDNYASF